MTKVRDFVAGLTRAGKSYAKIQKNCGCSLRGQGLEIGLNLLHHEESQSWQKNINDLRHQNPKKTKRTANIVVTAAADIKEDRRLMCNELASSHGVSYVTRTRSCMTIYTLSKS
jgi:hypothetical protein